MISQILGFSVLFILIFGGAIGSIIKFTLLGNIQANLSNRIAEERIENALKQTSASPTDTKGRTTSRQSDTEITWRIDGDFYKPSDTT